jgi:hypothetical protein
MSTSGVHEHAAEILLRVDIEHRAPDRSVEGHQPGALVDGVEHGGDVAVADQHLRLARDEVVVEIGEDARRAPAAGVADHGRDAVVGEHAVHVVRAVAVLAGEVPLAVERVRADDDLEAEELHLLLRDLDVVRGQLGRGGEDQPDRIAGNEALRLHEPPRRGRARSRRADGRGSSGEREQAGKGATVDHGRDDRAGAIELLSY